MPMVLAEPSNLALSTGACRASPPTTPLPRKLATSSSDTTGPTFAATDTDPVTPSLVV
ncbi:hypothetical protein M419DRAFT_117388 [Trichoderma reesei RUT C-30]|uniref:Uncharacterized protein n=1 Tax=Hypocrea jecorina (strain ATCC 56765 / BCRC 32924 / NRRL 11460 / Rut C-30) TaxID=1344414 RepID=A0A024SNM3_HYPJR|nr:hypothetical protein M419DRAFT_117388 [Trichoderma reesei RUT C-30]